MILTQFFSVWCPQKGFTCLNKAVAEGFLLISRGMFQKSFYKTFFAGVD